MKEMKAKKKTESVAKIYGIKTHTHTYTQIHTPLALGHN